jgi:ABC-type multidrug transport system fused ATPase/permease subunit
MTLPPKGNGSVSITINVPKNAAPGGRYAAVLFQPSGSLTLGNPVSGQETPVAIRLASLIYIRVAGPITEKAVVTKFAGPRFLEYGPAEILTDIQNLGDYHIAPVGSISMTDMFGTVVSKASLDTKNIFPGTSRSYSTRLGEKLMIGKFTVALAATYGDKANPLSASLTMWIFPWKVALAILLAFVIMFLLIMFGYKRFVKKEQKLVEELKEEKTELEELKEKFQDKVKDAPSTPPTPPKQTA